MLAQWTRNDRLKVARALGGAMLGALAAVMVAVRYGLLAPALAEARGGAVAFLLILLFLATAGFAFGWRTPRRQASWRPPPQAGD